MKKILNLNVSAILGIRIPGSYSPTKIGRYKLPGTEKSDSVLMQRKPNNWVGHPGHLKQDNVRIQITAVPTPQSIYKMENSTAGTQIMEV